MEKLRQRDGVPLTGPFMKEDGKLVLAVQYDVFDAYNFEYEH